MHTKQILTGNTTQIQTPVNKGVYFIKVEMNGDGISKTEKIIVQ